MKKISFTRKHIFIIFALFGMLPITCWAGSDSGPKLKGNGVKINMVEMPVMASMGVVLASAQVTFHKQYTVNDIKRHTRSRRSADHAYKRSGKDTTDYRDPRYRVRIKRYRFNRDKDRSHAYEKGYRDGYRDGHYSLRLPYGHRYGGSYGYGHRSLQKRNGNFRGYRW